MGNVHGRQRRRSARCLVVVMALALALVSAPPALAAPPANDERANALVIPDALPQSVTVDTTEATASPDDPFDFACFGGPSGATAWFSYTPDTTRSVVVETSASHFGGVNIFAVGPLGDLLSSSGSCLGGIFELPVTAGTTYLVMTSACCDPTAPGGTTTISLQPLPPPLEISVDIGATQVNQRTGVA